MDIGNQNLKVSLAPINGTDPPQIRHQLSIRMFTIVKIIGLAMIMAAGN